MSARPRPVPRHRRIAAAVATVLALGVLPAVAAPAAQGAIWPVVGPVPGPFPVPTVTDPAVPSPPSADPAVPDPTVPVEPPVTDDGFIEQFIASDVADLVAGGGLGPAASVQVVDVERRSTIYASRPTTRRIAASNTKLFTAAAALSSLGTETTFATTVARQGRSRTVTFVSGGDPRLTDAKIRALAKRAAAAIKAKRPARTTVKGKARRVVDVRLDDTIFAGATKLASWRQGGYGLGTIQPVRGTARTSVRSKDSAASATAYFVKRLDKSLGAGWTVRYRGRASVPKKARTVATVSSDTVHALVKRMLLVSDNQVAEVLNRHVARAEGYRASYAGGVKGTRKVMKRLGVDLGTSVLADGSGLSPANRITPVAVTNLLVVAARPERTELRSLLYEDWSLPLAGRTGTLAARFTGDATCARGAVVAKTGTLDWEIALSGYTVGADGRLKAFSIMANQLWTSAARSKAKATADRIATAVNGCY